MISSVSGQGGSRLPRIIRWELAGDRARGLQRPVGRSLPRFELRTRPDLLQEAILPFRVDEPSTVPPVRVCDVLPNDSHEREWALSILHDYLLPKFASEVSEISAPQIVPHDPATVGTLAVSPQPTEGEA